MAKAAYIDCSPFVHELLSANEWQVVDGLQINIGDPQPEVLPGLLDGCAGALNGHTKMDQDVLRSCPSLRSIVFLGTGASSYIDVAVAEQLGIRVRTVRGYGDRSVAEHAFALMLAAARRIATMDRQLRQGVWDPLSGSELEGKIVGIVGTGGIGSALARMAHGFGMQVLRWNRGPTRDDVPGQSVSLDDLLRRSDFVSLHLALTPETTGLIDATRLGLLQRHAVLINTARGALVDERTLLRALREERIAHAALDVFENEPLPPQHPFFQLENVTLTAHAGFKTPEASRRLALLGLERLRADLMMLSQGRPLGH